jgi:hypothetical protein
MSASSRRQDFWDQIREIARPIVVYWIFLGLMYGAFTVAVLLDDPSMESLFVLAAFGGITALSVLIGQVMAILRLRDWLVYAYWALMWTVGVVFGIFAAASTGFFGILVFVFVLFGPIFTLGGLWSLRVNRAIYATWVPLIYATGTAIIMAESKGKVETWKAGAKWAVWDVFTFSVLGLAIALLLVFLVTRETHRLHQWRRDPAAPLRGSVRESGAARPRLTLLGWLLMGFLAMGLAVGTAALGPYLWRTGPSDGDGTSDSSENGDPSEDPADPAEQPAEPGDGPSDRLRDQADTVSEQVQQDMEQRMERSISLLGTLLMLLVMFLVALLVFWRPARRLLLVRHWQRPLWRQSATERIDNGWRLVELAIADAGVTPRPGEPAERLYLRALPALEKISGSREVHGLLEAARIRDRVAYGLGVRPGEVELMNRVASWAHDTVWERLGERGQIKARYRRL